MVRILGVHGIGNYQATLSQAEAADVISRRWSAALRPRLDAELHFDLQIAYYADYLTRDIAQGVDDPEHLDLDEKILLLDWARQLGAPTDESQGRITVPVRYAIDWIARQYDLDNKMVRILMSKFCQEVSTYFNSCDRRSAARAHVVDCLAEFAPHVVIAHSLGSVVAYEALWQNPQHSPNMLITLGSPLGMPNVVFERLIPGPDNGYGCRPPRVRSWINISDPGDFIAIPRQLTGRFNGVTADLEATIHAIGFHRVTNYLTCAATIAALAAFLAENL